MKLRRKFLLLCAAFALASVAGAAAQQHIYPTDGWQKAKPSKYGYSAEKFKEIRKYVIDSMNTTGLMVVVGGESIYEFGSLTRVSYIASCRKSVLAMMYGKYVEDGTINLNTTIGELGIDDLQGLLPIEKKATIDNLITARSGVYHPASNSGDNSANAPKRGSKQPGTYYLYNNWDFNVAGEVFEMLTKKSIYEAFLFDIAYPIGMEDYELAQQKKGGNPKISKFPPYHFYFSTRDMARIGYLMLRDGKWEDKQVISKAWHDKIISEVSTKEQVGATSSRNVFAYGYMWWLFRVPEIPALKGAYTARGAMGQFFTVIPKLDMVIAHKTDAVYQRSTNWRNYYTLLQMIIDAKM